MFIRTIDPSLAALYEDSPGQTKEARLRGISMAGGDLDSDWLDRYRGTPLFDQAVALQQSVLQNETSRVQKSIQREQMLKTLGDEDYETSYNQTRLLELQKSSLDLELAKLTNAMGVQGADGPKEPLKPLTPALPANPTELAPLEPLAPEAPPAEAAPKLASVFERLGKDLAEGDVEALASSTKTAGPALGRLVNTGRAMLEHGVDTKKLMGFAKSLAPGVAAGALTGGVAGAANAGEGESTIGAGLKGALGGAALGGLAHGASKLHGASDGFMRVAGGDRVKAMTMAANKGGQSLLTGEGRAMARGLNQKMPGVPSAAPAPATGPTGPRQKLTKGPADPNLGLVPGRGSAPAAAPVAAPAAAAPSPAPAPVSAAAPTAAPASAAPLSPMPHAPGPEVGGLMKGFRDGRTIAGAPNVGNLAASPIPHNPSAPVYSQGAPASATLRTGAGTAPPSAAPAPAPAPRAAPVSVKPAPTPAPAAAPPSTRASAAPALAPAAAPAPAAPPELRVGGKTLEESLKAQAPDTTRGVPPTQAAPPLSKGSPNTQYGIPPTVNDPGLRSPGYDVRGGTLGGAAPPSSIPVSFGPTTSPRAPNTTPASAPATSRASGPPTSPSPSSGGDGGPTLRKGEAANSNTMLSAGTGTDNPALRGAAPGSVRMQGPGSSGQPTVPPVTSPQASIAYDKTMTAPPSSRVEVSSRDLMAPPSALQIPQAPTSTEMSSMKLPPAPPSAEMAKPKPLKPAKPSVEDYERQMGADHETFFNNLPTERKQEILNSPAVKSGLMPPAAATQALIQSGWTPGQPVPQVQIQGGRPRSYAEMRRAA